MPVIFTVFFPTHCLFKMTSCYISMLLFIYLYIYLLIVSFIVCIVTFCNLYDIVTRSSCRNFRGPILLFYPTMRLKYIH